MNLSVSEIKDFQEDEFTWWCRYVRRRVPHRPEPALYAGTYWHAIMADFIRHGDKSRAIETASEAMVRLRDELITMSATTDIIKEFTSQCSSLLGALHHYNDFVAGEETLLIEEPLSAPLPGTPHTLVGTPDRVIRLGGDGTIWHVQYKTISDRTSIPIFIAMAERSLHELIYSHLIRTHFSLPASDYGGTILNVVRKLSMKALRERPASAFIQEFIPIRTIEVDHALSDIRILSERMDKIRSGEAAPVQNRQLDGGRFGNVLSPYWDVRRGFVSLDDPTLFTDLPDRYEDRYGTPPAT
jgi:hypothetical protein